ncbi:hypothetical protein [Halonatronum saccharophilum]|uniref:hypothetical protein n=1 Tax=Halonatronum saccharophilum TaxID=150060 RepID=UPI00048291A3|nr:hypothetical protein [Halonatronum saccharophilum]
MNIEMIIGISFIFIITIQGIITLKNFSSPITTTTSNEGLNLLFRFISNSFIYISTILILIVSIDGGINNYNDLLHISIGKIAIIMILAVNLITIIGVITYLIKRDKNDKNTDNIVNQKKAKDI